MAGAGTVEARARRRALGSGLLDLPGKCTPPEDKCQVVGGWWLEKGAWIVGWGCRDDRGGRVRQASWLLLGAGCGRREDGGGMRGR